MSGAKRLEPPRARGAGMTWGRMIWFDVSRGQRMALHILYKRLGFFGLGRLMAHFGVQNLLSDPLKALAKQEGLSLRERMARYQFKPVVLLYQIMTSKLGLSSEQAVDVLEELISRAGARFIAYNMGAFLKQLEVEGWFVLTEEQRRQRAEQVLDRFFNMEAARVEDPEAAFGFDVTGCLFASLASELGLPELARPYCLADSVFFDDPGVPISLFRDKTLARGDDCCNFRFSMKEPGAGPEEAL